MKLPKEVQNKLGIKQTEIIFTKPPKVMIRSTDEIDQRTMGNVTTIEVVQGPVGASIQVVYKTETGISTYGTAFEWIDEIIVVND